MNYTTEPKKLLALIKENNNWRSFLEQEPRLITIKQCNWKDNSGNLLYPELYMFSYNGILSDFTDEYVRICRGCIVSLKDPNDPKFICLPFLKFGNQGQDFCPEIDWESALVQQKVDGILIKLFYYDNQWCWVTNNGWNTSIEAKEITQLPSKYKEKETNDCKTIQDLIDYCLSKNKVSLSEFAPDYTYMFELISPKIRILVDNPKTDLIYLGCRNIYNYNEYPLNIAKAMIPGIKKFNTVNYFDIHTLDDVIKLCNSYKGDKDEGVVICDKNFNRVKIKCEDYIRLKGYRNILDTGEEKILTGILEGTIDDALQVFPELQEQVISIQNKLIKYRKMLEECGRIGKEKYNSMLSSIDDIKQVKRDYANWVYKEYPDLYFAVFEGIKDEPNYNRFLEHLNYKKMNELLTKGEIK